MARVYLSSTRLDLEPERRAALDWLIQADHQPVHSYVADTQSVRQGCVADVGGCQAYVLILGYRYGFMPPDDNPDGVSITELEYRAARDADLPIVVLRARGVRDVSLTDIGKPEYAKLEAFVAQVERTHRVLPFADEAELVAGLSSGLQKVLRDGVGARARKPDAGSAEMREMLLTQSVVILAPQHADAARRFVAASEAPEAPDDEKAAAQALLADDPWPAASLLERRQLEAERRAGAATDPALAASERVRAAQCARDRGALVLFKDPQASLAAYLEAATCWTEDRSLWTSLGHLYLALGRLGDARRAFFGGTVDPHAPMAATPLPKLFTAFR